MISAVSHARIKPFWPDELVCTKVKNWERKTDPH